ncbi:MAG TPA: AAA family ATPase [Polyangiaceae bacterium]|nr:AAA family ATPase [Polyangiaceae bacterium]HNZ22511.1 AAA family ATPase [Polyangiaceae bacterium]HOD22749.1 AAA family ATPase [Polyangiaceae bacterium]HOE48517.1 AAA family ATPase [Polyangiaceae bacterium]HOH00184.1 AAA family ATPase [Polyangiaceae bacterium]
MTHRRLAPHLPVLMERIAIYGKGGIGKSVVATSLSAHFASHGKRVLHIGCDPKHDSAIRLMDADQSMTTVLDALVANPNLSSTEAFLRIGRHGVHCCEAGGPAPGVGCGGRGVARTLELLDELEVMEQGDYDTVVFDVLGDVVCGGFAAPLRQGFAQKVLIVLSEEPMALFAANNISKAIHTYHENGVVLAGLVANLRTPSADRGLIERFAQRLGTSNLAFIPRDPLIIAAERERKTIVEYAPASPTALVFAELAEKIQKIVPETVPLPTPLDDDAFFEFIRG